MTRPTSPDRIPIFALEAVLLPGAALPLHIFEPRYKLMIQRCIDNKSAFGVLLKRGEEPVAIGCTAAVSEVVQTYDDGRSDIVTVGQRIFAVKETFDDQPYTEATVEYLRDEPHAISKEAEERLWNLCVSCHKILRDSEPEDFDPEAGDSLAYFVARILPLDLEIRQKLLETRSESTRQSRLTEHLERWIPTLARVERLRARAGGNGHGDY